MKELALSACAIRNPSYLVNSLALSSALVLKCRAGGPSDLAYTDILAQRSSFLRSDALCTSHKANHARADRPGSYDISLVAAGRRGCVRTHVRNYKGAAARAALATPAPPRVVRRRRLWAGCPSPIHLGTGLPERKTPPQRVAQRVPRRAEAEARHERRWRRAAAAREDDNDAHDDGAPALLVVAPPSAPPGDSFQPATCAIDAAPSTSIDSEGSVHAGTD